MTQEAPQSARLSTSGQGNNVSVKYKLTAGLPSTTYTVTLWQWTSNDSGCNSLELGSVGTVTTSKKGGYTTSGTVSIPATVDHIFATGTAAASITTRLL